ncbi:Uncharacterised protein [Mycobacteroides abscessus]|nr:Uncharacterised protein [Mycobacteroides abscessus]
MTSSDGSAQRKTLLVFADSLSYYGPTGGLAASDPRIWPNIVAKKLDWDLELIARSAGPVGTCGGQQYRTRVLGRRYPQRVR